METIMESAAGFAFGLFLGIALTTLVFRMLTKTVGGANMSKLVVTCDALGTGIDVSSTAVADADCEITGVIYKVYSDPDHTPPTDPDPAGTPITATVPALSVDFNFPIAQSTPDEDCLVMWPLYRYAKKMSGAPSKQKFGPCMMPTPPPPPPPPPGP
jgi:hypothetical protein